MNARRRTLCLGSAAVALAASCPSFAATKPAPRLAVFGLGTNGRDILSRTRHTFAEHVVTATVHFFDDSPKYVFPSEYVVTEIGTFHFADVPRHMLARYLVTETTPRRTYRADIMLRMYEDGSLHFEDLHSVTEKIRQCTHVVLVASLADSAGFPLLRHFAAWTRSLEVVTSSAIVIDPFGLGERQLRSIEATMDRLTLVDNDFLRLSELPPDMSWSAYSEYANQVAAALLTGKVRSTELPFGPPA